MDIIDDESNSGIISWLPCGRGGFIINDRHDFAKIILPKYFSNDAKYASFARRLNRWHFVFSRSRKDQAIYFHPKFVKGNRKSCQEIQPKPQICYRKKGKPKSTSKEGNIKPSNGNKIQQEYLSGLQDAAIQQKQQNQQQQLGQDQIARGQTVGNSIHPLVLSAHGHIQGINVNALPPLAANPQGQVSNYAFSNIQSNTMPHQLSFPGAYQQFLPQQPVSQALLFPAANMPQWMQTPVSAISSADARSRILAAYPQMANVSLDPTMGHNPYNIIAKPIAAPYNSNIAYPSNGQREQLNIFNPQRTNTTSSSYPSYPSSPMTEDPRNNSATSIGMLNRNSSQGRDYSQTFVTNNDGNSVQPGMSAVRMDPSDLKQEPRNESTNAFNNDRFQRQDEELESLKFSLITSNNNEQHAQDAKSMTQSNLSGLTRDPANNGADILSNDTAAQHQIKMLSLEATGLSQASFTTKENLDSRNGTNVLQSASDDIPEGVKNFAGV